ncbi:HVO_2922 family protein [Halarchaeum sp. P4]|uniref:HVO_2922 family protein n=1 Tax=Halarchaeum sp. P4 TaxID=3421639 RepID=UPI003EC07785
MAPSEDDIDAGPDPDADPAAVSVEASETAPTGTRFELYQDEVGDWRWRLVHRNGNIIADGGEGYARKAGALNGIESVKRNAADAPVVRTEDDD